MKSILVFAPHPDDEILGCGGYLALANAAGHRVHVAVVTDGAKGAPRGYDAQSRRQECLAGLKILGISAVTFWDYPDGQVPLSGPAREQCRRMVLDTRPVEILLPAPTEYHLDHRRVTRLVLDALQGRWQGKLLFYETVQSAVPINHVQDISKVFAAKLQALEAHVSQLKQFDYLGYCENLARLRGVSLGKEFGEGFWAFPWDGTPQNFFETQPLISVVVRARDAELLRNALDSLIRQEYERLEVVLVWFGDQEADLSRFHYLDIHVIKGAVCRGYNLNLGIVHARGEYIAFLDEDDVLYPGHFITLLPEIHGIFNVDAVYSGARAVSCTRHDGKVRVDHEIMLMNRKVPLGRLLAGNLIPIHTALYRAGIFRARRFDETLEAYEDWEMTARLYLEGFSFHHADEITCEYRFYGVSGTGDESIVEHHREKGYAPWREKVLRKLKEKLQVLHLEHISSLIDGYEKDIAGLQAQVTQQKTRLGSLEKNLREFSGFEKLLAAGLRAVGEKKPGQAGLAAWIGRSMPGETLFSIILPVHDTPPELLSQTLLSVSNQAYPGWELCLTDDASTRPETVQLLEQLAGSPVFQGRLRFTRRDKQGGIVAASMDAIALAQAPYLAFLDHDDLLHPEALLTLALTLQQETRYGLLYTDSRKIDLAGNLLHIYHKADWSPETLLHLNFVNHLSVIRRDIFIQAGGLRADYEGGQDWDILLRLSRLLSSEEIRHIPEPLYDWRAAQDSLAYRSSSKPWAFEAAMQAVQAHLTELGMPAPEVKNNPEGPGAICQWQADCLPLEVIIPTCNNISGLKKCVKGLLEETDYPRLALTITVNRSTSREMQEYVAELAHKQAAKIICNEKPFNWSALNNLAVKQTDAPLLLFMNDDVEVLEPQWLHDLCRYLQLDGVGAAGATLFHADGSLQHNGIQTNPEWVAGNIVSRGMRNELSVTRNVSAATGACLLMPRNVYRDTGGFDERLAVSYGDVDMCLAIRKHGWRIVQAADVELIHHEMVSRGPMDNPEKKEEWEQASSFMREKWGDQLEERYLPRYEVIAQSRIINMPS
ncbi:MAG: glycosyltransferase [Gammaproteobacteria bacterium]|nr:glycosyltransferase [Gammaproteobacteria bacterium]